MKRVTIFSAVMIFVYSAAWSGSAGITEIQSIRNHFLGNELTASRYLSSSIYNSSDDVEGLGEDIYSYKTKSPVKAFLYSLAIPGAGEYYNGHKIRAGAFLAADAIFWSGYFIYHKKGADKETEYKAYADANYHWQDFMIWWDQLPTTEQEKFSHRLPFDSTNYVPIFNREYYENIGKYNQFQVGWPGGMNHPFIPPDGETWMGTNNERQTYLEMRKTSNDYFSKASTMIMISIANHVVSAFDAAIGAKRHNKGAKQYSMKLKTKMIDGDITPFITVGANF